jgi:hypothetical protein
VEAGVVQELGWGSVQGAIAVGCRARSRLGGEVYVCCIAWLGRSPVVWRGWFSWYVEGE